MELLQTMAFRLGIELDESQLELFMSYFRFLVSENQKINLTRITDYESVQLKHFLDSLTVLKICEIPTGARVMDIGSGAGFPGIPVRIAQKDIKLTLLDSVTKKTDFLKKLLKTLGLEGVEVLTGRAEDYGRDPNYRGKYDIVMARAVAKLSTLAEITLPFLHLGGKAILHKKGGIGEEMRLARKAVLVNGGDFEPSFMISGVEGLDDGRQLVLLNKIRPTPQIYPRRNGLPFHQPI